MKKLLHLLLPYIRPNLKRAIIGVLLAFPLSAIKGGHVWLVKNIVDLLTNAENPSYYSAGYLALGLVLLGFLNYPSRYFHFYLVRYVVDSSICQIRAHVYSKLQTLPLAYFSTKKGGSLVSNIMNDTIAFADGFRNGINFIREPLTALIMLGMAIYSDWQLALIILFVTPIFILVFVKSGKKVRVHQDHVQENIGLMTHNVTEGVIGQKITKAYNLQNYILVRFRKIQSLFFNSQMRMASVEENAHPLVELIGTFAFAGVIVFAHYRIASGAITTGDLFRFVTALALLMDPLRKFSEANVKMNQARAASERLSRIFELEEEKDDGVIELKEFKDSIEFENVAFSYDDKPIIKNLSFTIKKGEKVGVVGLSGAGKSTLVNLILRLYPTDSGVIKIDGIPIDQYTLNSLRKVFGLVSQDLFLFHDTIRENICLGKSFSEEEINNAVITSGVDDFLYELPKGLDTIIGDRGTRLSGGQGQRLTIARAILQAPSVLLFDEATSALDHSSEKKVQDALDRWSTSKTVMAVAHRLSTIQNYDKIIVMRNGQIIEQGSHNYLLNVEGEYSKLYNLSPQVS